MDHLTENLYISRELYSMLFNRVCGKYNMTLTEIIILLFLSNESGQDTARDIVDRLKLAKSHISVCVRDLENRGYLRGACTEDDHRTIHLRITETAKAIVRDAREIQTELISVMFNGLTQIDRENLARYIARMNDNMNGYLNRERAVSKP